MGDDIVLVKLDEMEKRLNEREEFHKERTGALCTKITDHIENSSRERDAQRKMHGEVMTQILDITTTSTTNKQDISNHFRNHDKEDKKKLGITAVISTFITAIGAVAIAILNK